MKTMIGRIRQAKTWQERVKLALNETPGTDFDHIFKDAGLATEIKALHSAIALSLGAKLVQTIQAGESQTLHNMANALNSWKRHKPKPNYYLAALFGVAGCFPPDWWKTWGVDEKGKLSPSYRRVPAKHRKNISMLTVIQNWKRIDPKSAAKEELGVRRMIQRYAREFGIPLDKSPGRKKIAT
jgi:hypothetical protein